MTDANEIRKKITNNVTGFSINRIPEKELKWFIEFAKESFCSDRGMALKHLIDFYNGIIPSGVEHLDAAIIELQERIIALEGKVNKPVEKKYRTTMDGTKVPINE